MKKPKINSKKQHKLGFSPFKKQITTISAFYTKKNYFKL